MKNILKTYIKDEIIFCAKCNNKVQAGSRWYLFCPVCKTAELNDNDITHVMSCTHCDKSLTILFHKEKDCTYGRCHTENCGDCFSMQDLTLIPLSEKIQSNSGNLKKVDRLEEIIKSLPSKNENIPSDTKDKEDELVDESEGIKVFTTNWDIPTSRGRCVGKTPNLDQLDRNYG